MDKLAKLLNKKNKQYLYKQKTNVWQYRRYEKDLERQGLFFKVKNDRDFINFEIIKTSYDNMQKIQDKFIEIKNEINEVWDVIDYQERHFLLYKELRPFMKSLKHFNVDGKRYFIAYFGDLINAYYDHDMLMFENDAYRKYLFDFKKITSPIKDYGILPLKANFSETEFIVGDNDNYVLYNKEINRFYHFNRFDLSFGFSKPLDDDQVKAIALLIYNDDLLSLITYIIDNQIANKRVLKKLSKRQRKILK